MSVPLPQQREAQRAGEQQERDEQVTAGTQAPAAEADAERGEDEQV
jgi:hypothetical protein